MALSSPICLGGLCLIVETMSHFTEPARFVNSTRSRATDVRRGAEAGHSFVSPLAPFDCFVAICFWRLPIPSARVIR